MRFKRLVFVLLITCLLLNVPALYAQEDTKPPFPPDIQDAIQTFLDSYIANNDLPGITLLIDSPQGMFAGASGYADTANQVPLLPDDAFRIGSISKMFTSTVILQLMEEGVLSLDDTLADWLPDSTAGLPNRDEITLRELMNHTSGIFNYTDDDQLNSMYLEDPTQDYTLQQVLDRVIEINQSLFDPGTKWSYSNTNYFLLGMVIEAATGSTAAEQLRTRIFEPVGMTHTFLGDAEPATADLVHGYTLQDGVWVDTTEWSVYWAWTAGALVSTPSDLALFIRALFAGDLFANADTLDVMLDPTGTGINRYGLGIGFVPPAIVSLGNLADAVWGHNGGIPGYVSQLTYVPDLDLVIVTLLNSDTIDPSVIVFNVMREARAIWESH